MTSTTAVLLDSHSKILLLSSFFSRLAIPLEIYPHTTEHKILNILNALSTILYTGTNLPENTPAINVVSFIPQEEILLFNINCSYNDKVSTFEQIFPNADFGERLLRECFQETT